MMLKNFSIVSALKDNPKIDFDFLDEVNCMPIYLGAYATPEFVAIGDMIREKLELEEPKSQEEGTQEEGTQEEGTQEFPVDRKRARFIKSKHAINRKRKIEPFTMSLRPTRNGGIKEGVKSDVHGFFKRYDRRVERYSAKEEVRRNADLDADFYMPSFWDDDEDWHLREEIAEFSSETSDGRVWHDADQISEMMQNEVDDLDYEDEEEIIARAFIERDLYEEFVNNFNLRTLFNKWLEEKKEGTK